MDSLIALLTILRYNPSLKSIDLSRPIPHYQYSNWMDDVAIHIAQMLEVINYE
jgi:protein tyrosine phosphatase